jgi:hypothetical protein
MQYWLCVTRSFRIAWDHKYLWLIALFSGEAGGFNFNYSQSTPTRGNAGTEQLTAAQTSAYNWLVDHAGLVVIIAIVWLALVVAFFVLGAICEGATVRASAEHDAERPFGLGWAWQSGLATMWVVIRFRLFLLLLYLPIVVVLFGFIISVFFAVSGQGSAAAFTGLFGILLLLAIPYAIYVTLLDRLGSRAVILEQLMARAGIVRAHRLLFKRFGRTLLVLLLSIGVALVIALALACILGLILVPLIFIGVAIGGSNSATVLPLVIIGVLVLLAISLVVSGFLGAQSSTYWTLAFRRLDLDYAPAPAYQFQPPPGPATPPPPLPQ